MKRVCVFNLFLSSVKDLGCSVNAYKGPTLCTGICRQYEVTGVRAKPDMITNITSARAFSLVPTLTDTFRISCNAGTFSLTNAL